MDYVDFDIFFINIFFVYFFNCYNEKGVNVIKEIKFYFVVYWKYSFFYI